MSAAWAATLHIREPRRGRGLWPTWLLSALLHVGLIVAWLNQAGPPLPRQVPRMEVRIIPTPPELPSASAPARQVQPPPSQAAELSPHRQPAARAPQPAAIAPRGDPEPGDSALPQRPAPDAALVADPPASPSSTRQDSPASPAPAPGKSVLRLDIPASRPAHPRSAPSVRDQALNDTRSNTHRPSAEARMATSVGDDGLQEEALGDGRRRLRKGSACVDVHRTHIAHLNPFDARLRDLNVAKPCD